MASSILKERLSKEQLILGIIYGKKAGIPTTIEEIVKELGIPRTTVMLHLNALEDTGLIEKDKKNKTIQYFPIREISQQIRDALDRLQSAYATALTFIHEKKLKELQEDKKK